MDLEQFVEKPQELIQEKKHLEDKLKSTEQWLKLAICVNGALPFRTIENIDKEYYNWLMDNTTIINGGMSAGGLRLAFVVHHPFHKSLITHIREITKEELDKIFNGEKIYE